MGIVPRADSRERRTAELFASHTHAPRTRTLTNAPHVHGRSKTWVCDRGDHYSIILLEEGFEELPHREKVHESVGGDSPVGSADPPKVPEFVTLSDARARARAHTTHLHTRTLAR